MHNIIIYYRKTLNFIEKIKKHDRSMQKKIIINKWHCHTKSYICIQGCVFFL